MTKKILIIRFSSIGDIILTTPVIRCLRNKYPGYEIHYLTKDSFAGLVYNNPYLNKVINFSGDLHLTIRELKLNKYDFIIDLHNNLRTARIKSILNVKSRSFDKLNIQKWLMVNFKWNRLPKTHIVNRYMKTLDFLGVEYDGKGLDFFIDASNEVEVSSLGSPWSEGYVGLVLGARHNTKKLPADQLIKLTDQINFPVVLLGGKEDYNLAQIISGNNPSRILNTCGKYNLQESASLVKQARVVVTHDTGLMHVAAAFGKKIISVWGNTIPDFGMFPILPFGMGASVIFENKELSCRPCSKIGFNSCPKEHFKCMRDLDMSLLADEVGKMLK